MYQDDLLGGLEQDVDREEAVIFRRDKAFVWENSAISLGRSFFWKMAFRHTAGSI